MGVISPAQPAAATGETTAPRSGLRVAVVPALPHLALVLALAALLLASYVDHLPSLYFYSDDLANEPEFFQGRPIGQLVSFAFANAYRYNRYQPAAFSLYAASYAVFGWDAYGPHLVVLAGHALAVCLVYLVGRRLSSSAVPAALAALLFAAFPAHTEVRVFLSAGYVYIPALCLSLLAALCWLSGDRTRMWSPRRWLGAALLLGALFFSEQAAPLALFPLLLAPPRRWLEPRWALRAVTPGLVALGIYLVLFWTLVPRDSPWAGTNTSLRDWTPDPTLTLLQGALLRPLLPPNGVDFAHLSSPYLLSRLTMNPRLPPPWSDNAPHLAALAALALAVAAGCAWLLAGARRAQGSAGRPWPEVRVGLGWFAATLVPVALLTPAAADRYLYLPSAGLCWAAGGLLAALGSRAWSSRPRAGPLAAGALLGLAVLACEWNTTAEVAYGWAPVGDFTKQVVQRLSVDYPSLPPGTMVVVRGLPDQRGSALGLRTHWWAFNGLVNWRYGNGKPNWQSGQGRVGDTDLDFPTGKDSPQSPLMAPTIWIVGPTTTRHLVLYDVVRDELVQRHYVALPAAQGGLRLMALPGRRSPVEGPVDLAYLKRSPLWDQVGLPAHDPLWFDTPQPADHPWGARFGAVARLHGYDLQQEYLGSGGAVLLRLYWELSAPTDGVTFHLAAFGDGWRELFEADGELPRLQDHPYLVQTLELPLAPSEPGSERPWLIVSLVDAAGTPLPLDDVGAGFGEYGRWAEVGAPPLQLEH